MNVQRKASRRKIFKRGEILPRRGISGMHTYVVTIVRNIYGRPDIAKPSGLRCFGFRRQENAWMPGLAIVREAEWMFGDTVRVHIRDVFYGHDA